MTPKESFVLKFLAHLSSQDLDHVHGDTDMARMFDRDTQNLTADSRTQRHFLVNLLATIMQQPPDSSILSTHLFNPGRVHNTFPLGSVHAHAVGPVHFDCGVQFTEDHDMIGAQPPLQDPASAHFVTLLSWGAFCLGHMFFNDVHATIYGPVMSHRGIDPRIGAVSDHAWLSTFMLMRAESCWRGLQLKAGLPADLRMLVLNQGLHNLLNTDSAKQADRQTFGSRQECITLESALRDVFYAAYNRRQAVPCTVFDCGFDRHFLHQPTICMLCGRSLIGLSFAADLSLVNAASQACMLHWPRDAVRTVEMSSDSCLVQARDADRGGGPTDSKPAAAAVPTVEQRGALDHACAWL